MKIKKIILYTLKNNKIIYVDIDFKNIKHFELSGISKTISHNTSGELIEFDDASRLELLIHKDMLDDDILNEIMKSTELISVGVELKNNKSCYYNLNKELNINIKNGIIEINI